MTITLKTLRGKAVAKKKITLKVNGKTYKVKTNSKGQTSVKVKLTAKKTYKYTVKFAGNKSYKAASKTGKIKIS